MKRNIWIGLTTLPLVLAGAAGADIGTAFTYQGHLENGDGPVTDTCDFRFGLWDTSAGGNQVGSSPQTASLVDVEGGIFTVMLDFGAGAIDGTARWLAIEVKCTPDGGFVALDSQRVALNPAPHALALPGLYTQQNLTSPNLIGGLHENSVTPNVGGATISGGGATGPDINRVTDDFGTVGGGMQNRAGDGQGTTTDSMWATVGGGFLNTASGESSTIGGGFRNTANVLSTVGGGFTNTASGGSCTVGGGENNTASGGRSTVGGGLINTASGTFSTVGGGQINAASASHSTVGGGVGNTASGLVSTVPGGSSDRAGGDYSLAAGRRAKANHAGSFVWADSTDADFVSGKADAFLIRASGGVGIGTAVPMQMLDVAGVVRSSAGGFAFPDGSVLASAPSLGLPVNMTQIATLRWDLLSGTTYAAEGNPTAVAFDGANIWVANAFNSNVTKLRASDGANLGTFTVGFQPVAIAFDGANIWVANKLSNTVTKLRASDGASLGTFPTGSGPLGVAFDGANIWVANGASDNVTKLRASDGANLGMFAVGNIPIGVAFDGANIWVANLGSDNVTKLRASDGTHQGNFAAGSGPNDVAFDGANIWVANSINNTVTKLRASDGANLGTFPTGSGPLGVAFDGANIWVANGASDNVTKLRASDGAHQGNFAAGTDPVDVAFDGASIWVANQFSHNVTKIFVGDDTDTGDDTTPDTIADDGVISDAEASDILTINNGLLFAPTSGNVGIGTATPTAKLHVAGATEFNGAMTVDSTTLTVDAVNDRVGIGTSSPAGALQLGSPGDVSAFRFGSTVGATRHHLISNRDMVFNAYDADPNSAALFSFRRSTTQFSETGGYSDYLTITDQGRVGISTPAPDHPLQMASGAHVTAGGVWTNGSDRNSKEKFEELNKQEILERVLKLPVTRWQYKSEPESVRHIGPVAQDFHAAFGTGGDDRYIGTIDADGVALAAIQGLHQIVQERDCEIENLKSEIANLKELEARLARLEALLHGTKEGTD